MNRPLVSILILAITALARIAVADPTQDGIKVAQEWQFALARTVNEIVKQGERDPKKIAKLAIERTQTEEKKVRDAGKAMGVSAKEIDESTKRDRKDSLDEYIKDALSRVKK